MTGRARWLLIIALAGLLVGVQSQRAALATLSLAVFLWILLDWVLFLYRVRFQLPRISIQRTVNRREHGADILWAGRSASVEVTIRSPAKMRPRLSFRDVVPEMFGILVNPDDNSNAYRSVDEAGRDSTPARKSFRRRLSQWLSSEFKVKRTDPLPHELFIESSCREAHYAYDVRPRSAGSVELPGFRITLEDRFGFFLHHRFVAVKQTFRVLPDYFQSGEQQQQVKRHNSLPRHGIHRLQSAGIGAELLELREYVPGDPPKSIAWKASARREMLMTRKYESEVPVRVQFFLDGTLPTRIGGFGKRLMDQLNFVAASVAKAAVVVGDPVTATLVDESRTKRLPWYSGDRGFMQLLSEIAAFSDAPPPPSQWLTPAMQECAMSVCRERYPELLNPRYHATPFSFFRSRRERYRLAAIIGVLHQLSPRHQTECYYDDAKLAVEVRKLLHQAGMAWMAPLILTPPAAPSPAALNMNLIATAIRRAVATARDNEVYVVLADVLSCAPNMDQLIQALKLAIAKHHRVIFVCPTPTFERPEAEIVRPESDRLEDLLLAAEKSRNRNLALQLKRDLTRLGVALAFSADQSAMRMVASEISMARDGRTSTRGVMI